MSSNLWAVVVAAAGGGGLFGVLSSVLTGLLSRPKVRADVVSVLTDAALKQVNELQERTAEAERAATEARQTCRQLTAEIDDVLARMRAWRAAILDPDATLPALRAMVTTDPGHVNGRHL